MDEPPPRCTFSAATVRRTTWYFARAYDALPHFSLRHQALIVLGPLTLQSSDKT
jgi:hypothetical protein